ncbi:hypothetical protein KIW84_051379 [Lathyrus oleraceus]|uniref:Uncharacterized protein n=1 Tax=Pisum sativum TaxID=3888 RepID=A0A9D4WMB5_PEA|nr:hypothetical protein KIW84_051379 [Pisum sativum]
MASKLKRKAGTAGKEKEKASSSSMDVQHFFKDHTSKELERYQKFYQKKIVQTPKFGDLSSFPEECFNFQDKLTSLGFRALITSSGPYYPDLVRIFYCNTCIENGKFVSLVKGKKITLTPKRLSQILDIPSGGHMLYDSENEVWNDYNKREFYFGSSRISEGEYHVKRVESHGGEEPPKEFLSAGNFFINDRLIHYFLAYVIFPRNSNHCSVSDMETQAFHKISIKNVDKWMGYRYNPETKSVMFIGGNNEENEEIPQEGNGGEDVPPPNVLPPSGLSNQYLFNFMTSQFSNLNTSINDQWI